MDEWDEVNEDTDETDDKDDVDDEAEEGDDDDDDDDATEDFLLLGRRRCLFSNSSKFSPMLELEKLSSSSP